jgi:ribonuclease HII
MQAVLRRPVGYTPRRDCGLAGYERILARAGLAPVAGIDEAGRGACAGPLVVAAAVLRPARSAEIPGVPGLADSKALSAQAREDAYRQIMDAALDWSVVIIPPGDIDRLGLHVCNVSGMRRALAGLSGKPGYVLTDGFPVRGLAVCVAAASVIAKVTRDRLMRGLHADYPVYGFARHKGYSTPSHMKALAEHGPCAEHRHSFVNVGGPRGARNVALAGPPDQVAGPSLAVGPVGAPEDGQNGPIVDVIGEHAWPVASRAPEARGT